MSKELPRHPGPVTDYWERSRWPIHGLYFLAPMLILYELGALVYAGAGQGRLPMIFAERLLLDGFTGLWGGGWSRWLIYTPPAVVLAVLVCWHAVRRDPWSPEPKLYGVMLLESLLWATPLFLYMAVVFRGGGDAAGGDPPGGGGDVVLAAAGEAGRDGLIPTWQAGVVLSVGAGIYEELLFRVIAIAMLHLVLVNLLTLRTHWGTIACVIFSATAFAFYHFDLRGSWSDYFSGIDWGLFVFYFASGVYFAVVYLLRGFGVVAATHAVYDVLAVLLQFGLLRLGR